MLPALKQLKFYQMFPAIRTGVLHSLLSDDWSSGDKVAILIISDIFLTWSWPKNYNEGEGGLDQLTGLGLGGGWWDQLTGRGTSWLRSVLKDLDQFGTLKPNEIGKEEWSGDFLGQCQNKRVKNIKTYFHDLKKEKNKIILPEMFLLDFAICANI